MKKQKRAMKEHAGAGQTDHAERRASNRLRHTMTSRHGRRV
jgi:hypothetical protein